MKCHLYEKVVIAKSIEPSEVVQIWSKQTVAHQLLEDSKPRLSYLIFRHDVSKNLFWPRNVTKINEHNTTAKMYSLLDEMDNLRGADKNFHFKLCYPGKNWA